MVSAALQTQFAEVADALGLGNPAIIEKDYWVVQTLQILSQVPFPYHQPVFSGGTALAKSEIKILRMSEDIDIKLIPNTDFTQLSRNQQRKARKGFIQAIERAITDSGDLQFVSHTKRDEDKYCEILLEYPQAYKRAPCLRPEIKLELMETISMPGQTQRAISSMWAEAFKKQPEVAVYNFVSLESTTVEKVLSILRRTALLSRYPDNEDDETLVRHIYDVNCIISNQPFGVDALTEMFSQAVQEDQQRYASKSAEFVANPYAELNMGLAILEQESKYRERFNAFVGPMVYGDGEHSFDVCFAGFKRLAEELIAQCK